jgi:A/G-specific adenine glycosylase
LLAWWSRAARDLPWRRTRDPYRVLVSEFMLQQTQVSRVSEYYPRFLERFPSLGSLARARPGELGPAGYSHRNHAGRLQRGQ